MDARTRAYYLRRIVQEQEAASQASCAEARERHEELAEAYRLRCRFDALDDTGSEISGRTANYAV